MFCEFIIPILFVLVLCYCLLPLFKYGVDIQVNKTKCLIHELTIDVPEVKQSCNLKRKKSKKLEDITPEMRADTCFVTNKDTCPIGSYEQCTNNIMAHKKCDCTDKISFEVCSNNDINELLHDKTTQNIKYADYSNNKCATTITDAYATRVNKWSVEDTKFNEPGNLHIKRTNPYVEELPIHMLKNYNLYKTSV